MAAFSMKDLLGPKRYTATTPWTAKQAVWTSVAIIIYAFAMGMAAYLLWKSITGSPERGSDLSVYVWVIFLVIQISVAILSYGAASMGHEQGSRVDARQVLSLQPASEAGSSSRIRPYATAFAAVVVVILIYTGITWLIWPEDYFKDLLEDQAVVNSNLIGIFALVAVVGAPLSEELLFRGFLLPALAQTRLGFAGAAVVTSAGWTALHTGYSAITLGEIFLLGLFFSAVLWRTGSLWVTIVLHGLINLAIILILLAIGPGS